MADALRRALLAVPLMAAMPADASEPDAFSFRFASLEGGEIDLAAWRGRVLLVVNTASFCGFTPQYAALQRLHDRYQARGLVVLGVPSNDFNQEAGNARQIREFCDAQFGIEFPMAGLTRVRGVQAHPFFRWASSRAGGEPRWNFHKYLVARDGRRVQGFATRIEPDSREMTQAIEAALAAPTA
ncbi:glutathione peroxidase [Roseomonas sp. PWR1]|uniref:Glutathione peroxidase n=1 Tax=Roseomonas nitratireducens TaxID=2820810 RepID=A0ABS4AWS4_9PROT|nr:glutathione peroxidase [Neoroseomonas nitratireducens]MBP0465815.1 glutathione peroxidase [Neoroseomonas nitratireducens]